MTNAGSAPKASANGTTLATVSFNHPLYAQATATAARWIEPARHPDSIDSGMHVTAAITAAIPTDRALTPPDTMGLSTRPAR